MPQKKRENYIEVLVLLTPKQIEAIFSNHPDELSFTRSLVEWDLTGRRSSKRLAKRLEADANRLIVTPEDDIVPPFVIQAT